MKMKEAICSNSCSIGRPRTITRDRRCDIGPERPGGPRGVDEIGPEADNTE